MSKGREGMNKTISLERDRKRQIQTHQKTQTDSQPSKPCILYIERQGDDSLQPII